MLLFVFEYKCDVCKLGYYTERERARERSSGMMKMPSYVAIVPVVLLLS